jgi:hypothetical protein
MGAPQRIVERTTNTTKDTKKKVDRNARNGRNGNATPTITVALVASVAFQSPHTTCGKPVANVAVQKNKRHLRQNP